jgi:hypothetical protein
MMMILISVNQLYQLPDSSRFQGHCQDSFHFCVRQSPRRSGARFIHKSVKSLLQEPTPPFPDRLWRQVQLQGSLRIHSPLGARKNIAGPPRQYLSSLDAPSPLVKHFTFLFRQRQFGYRPSILHHHLLRTLDAIEWLFIFKDMTLEGEEGAHTECRLVVVALAEDRAA